METKDIQDSQAPAGIPDTSTTQDTNVQLETVSKEEYTNAQAFGTKARQAEIAMATRLVTKDSSELHSIEDVKVRDAVTRDLLKMSYAEASAIYGSNFDISKSTGDEPGSNKDNGDEDTPMARKVRQLEYRDALREKESAMSNFISKNGDLFAQGSDAMIARIDAELEFISNKLPIDERIKRAASIAMGSPVDTTSLAYSILQNASARKPNGSQQREDEEVKLTKFQEEIRDFFKTNK